jgi:hypothetical protein
MGKTKGRHWKLKCLKFCATYMVRKSRRAIALDLNPGDLQINPEIKVGCLEGVPPMNKVPINREYG